MTDLKKRFPRYNKLLKLYPVHYRQKYGDQMLQTLADMIDDPKTSKIKVWLQVTVDLPLSITKQQLSFTGEIMAKDMPDYIKQTGIISALLLAPFFTFLTLDAITAHSLYSSWFWEKWVASTWLVFMPAAAFLIALITFVFWYHSRRRVGFWKKLFDFRHNWPMMVIAGLSFGIIALAFGHDSVHCVVNNPVKEIRDWHTTWTCVKNG